MINLWHGSPFLYHIFTSNETEAKTGNIYKHLINTQGEVNIFVINTKSGFLMSAIISASLNNESCQLEVICCNYLHTLFFLATSIPFWRETLWIWLAVKDVMSMIVVTAIQCSLTTENSFRSENNHFSLFFVIQIKCVKTFPVFKQGKYFPYFKEKLFKTVFQEEEW